MARRVTYDILDAPDGRFTVIATIEPDKRFFRTELATHAEAQEWVEGLRDIMASLGAPVSLALPEQPGLLPVSAILSYLRKTESETDP
jgi:hypothetical protein